MGHFQKLLQARESAARGESIDAVMKRLRPPVHFSRATSFKDQAQRWSGDKLGEALDMLLEAETLTRTTLGARRPGERVNLEVDVLAKYVERMLLRTKAVAV